MNMQVNNGNSQANLKYSEEAFKQVELQFAQVGIKKDEIQELFAQINSLNGAFKSAGLDFGQDLASYEDSDLNRGNQTSVNFFYNRNKVLNMITKALMTSHSQNDFYNFISYTQKEYEAITKTEESSPILKELIGSAKRGLKDLNIDEKSKTQLNNLLDSNPQNAIFNPYILEAAKNEMLKRAQLVAEVNGQSVQNDSFLGRFSQFGLGGAITVGALTGLVSSPIRMFADLNAGNKFTWRANLSKGLQGKTAFSQYMNTPGGLFHGWGTNPFPYAKDLGYEPLAFREFKPKLSTVDGKIVAKYLDGSTKTFNSTEAFNKAQAALRQKKYDQYLVKEAKEFIKKKKAAYKTLAESKKGLEKLSTRLSPFAKKLKTIGKYLPKRLGWVAAGLAALGFVSTQASSNPNWHETAENTVEGTKNVVNSVTAGAVSFLGDWFIPDFGVLTGTPWKEENQFHNVIEGAYA